VVVLNDVTYAKHILGALARNRVSIPVALVLAAPGGVVVGRYNAPSLALERVGQLRAGVIPAGQPELGIVGAGLVLNELMFGGSEISSEAETIGAYSLHRQRRIPRAIQSEGDLISEVSSHPVGPISTFKDRSFIMVGGGALGNWAAITLALESPSSLVIYDGDPAVEIHNVNRQILLVRGAGMQRPKAEVLAAELGALDPEGNYEGVVKFIEKIEDLPLLDGAVDALLCLPDNNRTRIICDDARRGADVVFATAASSAVGGQAILSHPGQPCLRCLGISEQSQNIDNRDQSCSLIQSDAVVSSNMVAAGLMLSELREGLAGRPTANVRFVGDARSGNRLVRMISRPKCTHHKMRAVPTNTSVEPSRCRT
jgi:molybdopterin/thiamine biosynthesis adenylyltransferase